MLAGVAIQFRRYVERSAGDDQFRTLADVERAKIAEAVDDGAGRIGVRIGVGIDGERRSVAEDADDAVDDPAVLNWSSTDVAARALKATFARYGKRAANSGKAKTEPEKFKAQQVAVIEAELEPFKEIIDAAIGHELNRGDIEHLMGAFPNASHMSPTFAALLKETNQ